MPKALFAAGCFWGVQFYFDQVPGVTSTQAGYTGGYAKNPNYEQVCAQSTGHAEAVLIDFSEEKVSYINLCKQFFRMHDPTQLNRQGPDIGDNYRSAIFYFTKTQKEQATRVMKSISSSYNKPIVTQIVKATEFYPAEAYHQKFTERTGRGVCHVAYEEV